MRRMQSCVDAHTQLLTSTPTLQGELALLRFATYFALRWRLH